MQMIKRNKQKRNKTISSIVFTIVFMVLATSFVSAIAYAPITIYGKVTIGESPLLGAKINAKSLSNQTSFFSVDTRSNENGEFVFVITREDTTPINIQITTVYGDDIYVDIIKDALPWYSYSLDMDVSVDAFAQVKIRSSSTTNNNFDADMEKIISGDIIDNDDLIKEFEEKYDMEIVSLEEESKEINTDLKEDAQIEPSLESPNPTSKYLPAPEKQKTKGLARSFLEILAVVLVICCIVIIRHEAKRE
jgi:hypothetical protein